MPPLAWGARVSPTFRARVRAIAAGFAGATASDLMSCIAFESARTFRADERNAAGSGAVGLIQFMPQTAAALGTSTAALAGMTAEEQLFWVEKYFRPWRDRLRNLGDLYCTILWPAGVGQADTAVLFRRGGDRPKLYLQNRGLDLDRDGDIDRGEVTARVRAMLAEGLRPANAA